LREELGVVAELGSGTPDATLSDPEAGIEMSVWIVDAWQGDVTNASPEEHDEIRWCGADDIATLRLAHPSYLALLQHALAP
jgi:8-oxo-dGTP pyrophosphatase MutT (NUDIX family)